MGHAERIGFALIGLTAAGGWLAETGRTGWPLALVVAALIALKGRLVIDHYMEMRQANPRIRRVQHGFVTALPLMVLASQAWSPILARLTTID